MPEIIEVKKYADFIKKNLLKKNLKNIIIKKGRYKIHGPFQYYSSILKLLPSKLIAVNTKGKFMYLTFDNKIHIGFTLGLSGGWFYKPIKYKIMYHGLDKKKFDIKVVNKYYKNSLKHLNVEFKFDIGTLYFYDQLSYGTIKVFLNDEELNEKLNSIGCDILQSDFSIFFDKIMKKNNLEKPIGNVLLNQKSISGIGNYMRADSLWLSKISPFRLVKNLNKKELIKLYKNLLIIIWADYNYKKGIKLGIIKKNDKIAKHLNREFLVYNRKKDPNGNEIKKEKLYEGNQIRYIYWVPNYQK
jgi:formamidopyrimidine-DNA glycosylase